jgi:phosphoadenosine phosphosulfate reductase
VSKIRVDVSAITEPPGASAGGSRWGPLVGEAAPGLTGARPQKVLEWAYATFPADRITLCTSFQDEGMVLLDIASRINPELHVLTIDSGRLPDETLELIDRVRKRYRIRVEVLYPDAAEVSALVTEHGVNLFYESPGLRLSCCDVRKVRPLARRLRTLDAWITGLRRDQAEGRAGVAEVEIDERHGGIVKLNPLARWTQVQVQRYLRDHDVPRNPLYAQGYTSIGCAPCTRATAPGEDSRAGRWWWESGARECGLHYELKIGADGQTKVATMRNLPKENR